MNSRKRNVLIRMCIALAVFAYVGYLAYQQLARFDFGVIIGFFLLYLLWTLVMEMWIYQDPDSYVIEDDDKKSYIYLQLSFLVALFFATIDFVEWHWTRQLLLEPGIIYAGFVLFIISCIIRWWGFQSIGKYFNPRVAIYEDHQLIKTGAYSKIRHPLYLGSMISFIAIPMVFNSWGSLLIILCTTIPALVYRINVEEELMEKHFQEAYQEYKKDTKRMIPGIW